MSDLQTVRNARMAQLIADLPQLVADLSERVRRLEPVPGSVVDNAADRVTGNPVAGRDVLLKLSRRPRGAKVEHVSRRELLASERVPTARQGAVRDIQRLRAEE